MFKFFGFLENLFNTLWELITNLVTGLINAVIIVQQSVSLPLSILPYVPSFIFTSISIVVAIGIIKLIIGWGNQ